MKAQRFDGETRLHAMRRLPRLVAAEKKASARVISESPVHRRKPSLSIRISADERCRDPHVRGRGDRTFDGAPTNVIAAGWRTTLVASHPHGDVPSHFLQPRVTRFTSAIRLLGNFFTAVIRYRSNKRSRTLQIALHRVFQLPPQYYLRVVISWLSRPEVSEL